MTSPSKCLFSSEYLDIQILINQETIRQIKCSYILIFNYRFLLEACNCNANIYDRLGDRRKKPLCIAIEKGHISLIKLLLQHGVSAVETVDSHEKYRPIHVAILSKQRQALQILLEHGANPDDKTTSGATPAQLAVDNDASTLLPLLLSYGISFAKRDVYGNTLLHTIAKDGAVMCAEFLLGYLAENHLDQIQILLLEEKDTRSRTPVDRAVQEGNEAVLIQFFRYIDCDYFIQHPTIYHQMIGNNLFEALKVLIDESVHEKYLDVTLNPKFLDSINSLEHPYPEDPQYNRFEPSFLHKLLYCSDPLVKYHPLVSIVVREKLRFYRWWYVFTFFLYCVFLVCLFYALIQASYLCDDMLLSYNDAFSMGRAFCEVIVVISWILISADQKLAFLSYWYRLHKEKLITDQEKDEFVNPEHHLFSFSTICDKINRLVYHFFSALYGGFSRNILGWSARIFMFVLIILRLCQSPYQWTFASITIVLYSLMLYKYSRILPSLAIYVHSIVEILKHEIPRFLVIILVFILTYSGAIHLAARQTFLNQSYSELTGNTCSNNSNTGIFWFNEESTKTYDGRIPLLSGITFLLNGGPCMDQGLLRNANFMFTFMYLIFSFIFIVVMVNILIAQFVSAYNSLMKMDKLQFNIDLVVESELRSSFVILFGRKLRDNRSVTEITLSHQDWNFYRRTKPVETPCRAQTNYSKKIIKLFEMSDKESKLNNELVQYNIAELKLNQERILDVNVSLEQKLASLDAKLNQLLQKEES